MRLPSLLPFSLVGGTPLALRFGHRGSVDLVLFTSQKFDHAPILEELTATFGNNFVYKQQNTHFGIFCFINEIKVDLVNSPHPLIRPVETIRSVRFYSHQDIAAMKIQAILGRGRKKDFWDLYELLKHYSLQQIMDWHYEKYPTQMLAISIPHAITYFVDADQIEAPVSYKGQTWEEVKQGISKAVRDYLI